mmetsp:Transcript_20216/g.45990  ORF Transcript_20216/g.45990 Transcript_20216/m.45990 type:complete len:229 (+) Transcript_20216:1238-1924(+)
MIDNSSEMRRSANMVNISCIPLPTAFCPCQSFTDYKIGISGRRPHRWDPDLQQLPTDLHFPVVQKCPERPVLQLDLQDPWVQAPQGRRWGQEDLAYPELPPFHSFPASLESPCSQEDPALEAQEQSSRTTSCSAPEPCGRHRRSYHESNASTRGSFPRSLRFYPSWSSAPSQAFSPCPRHSPPPPSLALEAFDHHPPHRPLQPPALQEIAARSLAEEMGRWRAVLRRL